MGIINSVFQTVNDNNNNNNNTNINNNNIKMPVGSIMDTEGPKMNVWSGSHHSPYDGFEDAHSIQYPKSHVVMKSATLLLYTACMTMLQVMENWVEDMMDSGDEKYVLQARILAEKVFEANFLLSRASAVADDKEIQYIHGIVERVYQAYNPFGNLERRAREGFFLLNFLCFKLPHVAKELEEKIVEAEFLLTKAMTARDGKEVAYVSQIITRLSMQCQAKWAPYKASAVP